MQTITIEEAQAHLADLLAKLEPGEEVALTRNGLPVARLIAPGERSPAVPYRGHFIFGSIEKELPPPRFRRFERVRIREGARRLEPQYLGEIGTVVWLESSGVFRHPHDPDMWFYIVHLPGRNCWPSFRQFELESLGEFDVESALLGTTPEVTFDLILEQELEVMEGCYRLPGLFWQVVVFLQDDVPEIQYQTQTWVKSTRWELPTTGVAIRLPRTTRIDRASLLFALHLVFGWREDEWTIVRGPDSMILR